MEADGRPAFVDYAYGMHCAEEVAAQIVETILTNGGDLLWQKYLERKAFAFASNTAQENLTSSVEMCFVAHDPGEHDLGADWELEEEPVPAEIDSWARMHLSVRRRPARSEDMVEQAGSHGKGGRERGKDNRSKDRRRAAGNTNPSATPAKNLKTESRAMSIVQEMPVDEEEERLREVKVMEEARARERKSKQLQAERSKEEERKKVEQIHAEMEKRPHTFDHNGVLMWMEDVKADRLDRLAKVQEVFTYSIRKDPKEAKLKPENADKNDKGRDKGDVAQNADNARSGRSGDRRGDRGEKRKKRPDRNDEPEFADSFAKLQHGQPPIMETMSMKPGVVLGSQGRTKAGPEPDNPNRQMSRKEYFFLAEKEAVVDGRNKESDSRQSPATTGPAGAAISANGPTSVAAGAGDAVGAGNTANQGVEAGGDAGGGGGGGMSAAALVAAAMEEAGAADAAHTGLPPIPAGRATVANSASGKRATGTADLKKTVGNSSNATVADGDKTGKVLKAPKAPSKDVRFSRQSRSVGHLPRPPRFHVPPLGGPSVFFAAPPPLGATMGHGLVQSDPTKESFFFPSPRVDLSSSVRSRSVMSSDRLTPTGRRSKGFDETDEISDGRIHAEKKNAAYRIMRSALGSDD